MMEALKKHDCKGVSQFELTKTLLNNLQQFEITPTAKLVLLYLSSCYNPKKADIFPKQKTIAAKIGVSERSVVRAVQELFNEGLIIIECKYTNRYKFTSKLTGKQSQSEKIFEFDILSENKRQNDNLKSDNLSHHDIEQKKEQKKEHLSVTDLKILKKYAQEHGAQNVEAYIKALQKSGADKRIIKEQKIQENIARFHANKIKETKEKIDKLVSIEGSSPLDCPAWVEFKKKLFMRN